MSLVKRTYVDGETVITAENLNAIQDAIIENEEAIEAQGEAIDGKYTKPSGGIPASDMASGVQTSLEKADSALQSSDIDNTLTVTGKAADAKKTGDEISDVRNTLSHKADFIYDTASGPIASFPDGADGLPVKDLTVAIEPVQSGTGDPSPTNVRPISGWTGMDVYATGKNILYKSGTNTENGYVNEAYLSADGSVGPDNNIYITEYIRLKPNTAYTISGVSGNARSLCLYDKNKNYLWGRQYGGQPSFYFTTTATTAYIRVSLKINGVNEQLEEGQTATTYEPFGTTLPISWRSSAGTVYGGTLDVTSGVLTVTDGYADLGTLSWGDQGTANTYQATISDMLTPSNNIVCSHYPTTAASTSAANMPDKSIKTYGLSASKFIIIKDSSYSAVSDFALAMSGVQLVYELATPLVYNLTPTEVITTLLGQNNVWSDTGSSTVEYPADTKLYIDKKLAALVAALS